MDVQKAREAFERRQAKVLNMPYKELKARFDENFRLFGARYNIGSINEKEWNLWLEAWQAAKAQVVPEGFVLMPKEPTEKMNKAGLQEYRKVIGVGQDDIGYIYKAMIEAQEPAND